MGASKNVSDKALAMLRGLPRISLSNIRDTTQRNKSKRGRGQYGGDKHGAGNKGSGQRQNFMRLGYETGNNPFFMRFPYEPYYQGHHLRKQYPRLSLLQLQKMIETDRIDTSKPIDMATICNTGLFEVHPDMKHYGINLTDEGADSFNGKINIEVQWTSEGVIAAIEKHGGLITTAFYDINSLWILRNPQRFFQKGEPLPRRMLPSEDTIEYYTSPTSRGYLADPEEIAQQRFVLSQKYGYQHKPVDQNDPLFSERKDPRQIFYGLEPGWIVNLVDKCILKPQDQRLEEFFRS